MTEASTEAQPPSFRIVRARFHVLLGRYRTGDLQAGSAEHRLGELLDQLARTGDLDRRGNGRLTNPVRWACMNVSSGYASILKMLFPSGQEIGALATLLICEEGWNLSVLDTMGRPRLSPRRRHRRRRHPPGIWTLHIG